MLMVAWLGVQLMAEEMGLKLDREEFEACMEEQRQRSRAAGKAGGGPTLKFEAEATAHLANIGVPITDDSPKCAAFPFLGAHQMASIPLETIHYYSIHFKRRMRSLQDALFFRHAQGRH